jgi:hypothetical protein
MQSRRLPSDPSSHLPQDPTHLRARHYRGKHSLLLHLVNASERRAWR